MREARQKWPTRPLDRFIEGPLMAGMSVVGALFGAGQNVSTQVVKACAGDEKTGPFAYLCPFMEADKNPPTRKPQGAHFMATVKGGRADIGIK